MQEDHERRFGLISATMIGVGAIVETTLFVMIGHAADLAGPGVFITFMIGAIINYFVALNYSELAAALPITGGGYAFTEEAIGKFPAFINGWFIWLGTMFYCALCSLGVGFGLKYFIPNINLSVIAVIAVLVFMIVNIKRTKKFETVLEYLILGVIGMLAVFIIMGLLRGPRPDAFSNITPHGWPAVFTTSGYIFICFIGFSVIPTCSEEIKNPSKNVPRAILLSLTIGTIIYVLITYVAVGLIPYQDLAHSSTPLSEVGKVLLGSVGSHLMAIGLIIASLAGCNSSMMASTRVMYALSRDGYFPFSLSRVHEKLKTPYLTVIICSIMIATFSAVGIAELVSYAADFGFLISFALVSYSVILFRKKHPNINRPFKVPLYPFIPLLGVVFPIILLIILPTLHPEALALGSILTAIGLLVYYVSMLGYTRLRISFGGITVMTGFVISVATIFIWSGLIPLIIPFPLLLSFFFIGILQILVGFFNIIG